jgi:hypothetical protein
MYEYLRIDGIDRWYTCIECRSTIRFPGSGLLLRTPFSLLGARLAQLLSRAQDAGARPLAFLHVPATAPSRRLPTAPQAPCVWRLATGFWGHGRGCARRGSDGTERLLQQRCAAPTIIEAAAVFTSTTGLHVRSLVSDPPLLSAADEDGKVHIFSLAYSSSGDNLQFQANTAPLVESERSRPPTPTQVLLRASMFLLRTNTCVGS